MEINCQSLSNIPGLNTTGFVVIRSANELDVVAVYTVERSEQSGVSLEVQNITGRLIQTDHPMCPG